MIAEVIEAFFLVLTAFMIAYLVRHYLFTLVVIRNSRRTPQGTVLEESCFEPTVSILVPACDEEQVVERTLQRMNELSYPKDKLQIILVDDASQDRTGEIADQFRLKHNSISVLHRCKSEGRRGKASALNYALKHSTGQIVLCFDADYYPQKDIVTRLVREFADTEVGAVQGRVIVLNEPRNIVTRLVALERIGGYCVDQQARDSLGLITQFGGTVGGFRRDLLEKLGGWDDSMLAEDTDLTLRVYLAGYKIRYVNDAECYEEAVENWRAYWKQRSRWAKGHMQCFFKHAFSVVKSGNLRWIEKIDGLLLLGVYFMPLMVLLSWILAVPLFMLQPPLWAGALWICTPIALYSFVGNFAPFFGVGVGTYLDGRKRAQWLIPLLVFMFLYNIPICTKAFIDVLSSKLLGTKLVRWEKTIHSGDGNSYIMS